MKLKFLLDLDKNGTTDYRICVEPTFNYSYNFIAKKRDIFYYHEDLLMWDIKDFSVDMQFNGEDNYDCDYQDKELTLHAICTILITEPKKEEYYED